MSQHTPGPWKWDDNRLKPVNPDPNVSAVHSILDAEGGFGFLGSNLEETIAELDADRALIAAAPDLLAALQQARNYIADAVQSLVDSETNPATWMIDSPEALLQIESDQDLLNQIEAAIAKATGEQA